MPIVLERQLPSLPLTTYIDEQGSYQRACSGYLAIFGIDLSKPEWHWLVERLDFPFLPLIDRTLGLTPLRSSSVLDEHTRAGRRWEITIPVACLMMAGVPLHSAVNANNLPAARSEAYLLVDPIGISDHEVELLAQKHRDGACIVIIGEVAHERLLEMLGLQAASMYSTSSWAVAADFPQELDGAHSGTEAVELEARYRPTEARLLVEAKGGDDSHGSVLASIYRPGTAGSALYLASTGTWETGHKESVEPRFMTSTYRIEDMGAYVREFLPTPLELLFGGIVTWGARLAVTTDEGQMTAYEHQDGSVCVVLENIGNLFYTRPSVQTNFSTSSVSHYPIKNPSPAGYLVTGSTHSGGFQISLPPDAAVPLRVGVKGR